MRKPACSVTALLSPVLGLLKVIQVESMSVDSGFVESLSPAATPLWKLGQCSML